MFKKDRRWKFGKAELTILVKATGVILFWRGAWGLMDLYIFPENEAFSYIFTVVFGILLLWADDLKLNELMDD